ncbi:hypothetical protein A6R68_18476, partial [Neotoma lepida]
MPPEIQETRIGSLMFTFMSLESQLLKDGTDYKCIRSRQLSFLGVNGVLIIRDRDAEVVPSAPNTPDLWGACGMWRLGMRKEAGGPHNEANIQAVNAIQMLATTSTTTTTTVTTNTTTTITSGFNLYFKPPASPWVNDTGLISVASLPVTMTVNSIITPVMTYGHLGSMVDKWNCQLQEQEKHFLYQANRVNVWNHTLIESRDEITFLHYEVEKVKLDQSRLERELDFILAQQKELEHLLTPLEEFVKEQNGPFNLLYVDKEYERIYKLAEHIDAELKRMSQDLKDIIVHLNSHGSLDDAPEPLQQICKLLNAHMDSLQWISQNSVNSTFGVELKEVSQGIMQKKVEEVTKAFEEYRRKEQECSMKFAF